MKSSLHLCKFYVGRNLQAESLHQDCLMFGGAADTPFANRDAGALGQHDIDQRDLLEFGEDLARFVAKPARWHQRPSTGGDFEARAAALTALTSFEFSEALAEYSQDEQRARIIVLELARKMLNSPPKP